MDEGAVPCVGDCDGAGTVTVDELVMAVNNALAGRVVGESRAVGYATVLVGDV